MTVMLNCSSEGEILLFRKVLMSNVGLMEAMREVEFGRRLIEDW